MKKILYYLVSAIFLLSGTSCEKDTIEPTATSNITVVNAAVDNGAIKVNAGAASDFTYAKATDLAFGASFSYGSYTGPKTITVVKSPDTTKSLFSRLIDLKAISTLYIAGQSPIIDTMYRVETNLPYLSSNPSNPDYSMYIRFVNLSPNSPSLNVNIRTVTTKEVTGLAYQGISEFKKYVALTTTANYVFEVTDPVTNAVLSTFTLNTNSNRFKTISLIIKGLKGTTTGVNAFGVFQVNYTG